MSKKAGHSFSLEEKLYEQLIQQSRRGFPFKKENVHALLKSLLLAENIPNPFPNGVPGKTWYYALLKRFPDLSEKSAEYHYQARVAVTGMAIKRWFSFINDFASEENLTEVFHDSARVISCKEIPFRVCNITGKKTLLI